MVKVKPAKVKKKHPVFKRMVLSIVSGIVFGLFAGAWCVCSI